MGTRGDVQPMLCLAKGTWRLVLAQGRVSPGKTPHGLPPLATGLLAKGHQVTLCTHAAHETLVKSFDLSGLEFVGFKGDFEALQRTAKAQRLLLRQDFPGLILALQDVTQTHYTFNADTCYAAGSGSRPGRRPPSLLVATMAAWTLAVPLAEAWGVPLVMATFVPALFPADEQPPVMLSPQPLPFAWMNRLALWVFKMALLRLTTNEGEVQGFQRRIGVELTSLATILEQAMLCPWLLAYSPTLSPVPEEWGRENRPVTPCGYLADSTAFDPTGPGASQHVRDLARFLDGRPHEHEHDRPLYFGWGSMVFGDSGAMTRMVLQAVRATGRRAVLQSGWAGLNLAAVAQGAGGGKEEGDGDLLRDVDDRVFEIREAVPHGWLFPRCSAVVHHGGCGTTHTALAAGVPQIITPVTADQPFWAYRVAVMGVGPSSYTPAHRITATRLAEMISEVTRDKVRARAVELAALMRDEDGVTRAIEALEALAEGGADFWGERRAAARDAVARATLHFWGAVSLLAAMLAMPVMWCAGWSAVRTFRAKNVG
jgi:sterol 3beta-glucosyltransferase